MRSLRSYSRISVSLAAFVAVFLIPSLRGELGVLLLVVLLALASPRRRDIFLFFRKFTLLILITLAVHLFFRFGEPSYWQAFGSSALWDRALYFSLRNTNILFVMSYLIKSGPELSFDSLSAYLDKRGPAGLLQPVTIGMRYSSLIRDEFRSLQQVHRIMGIRRPRNIFRKAHYFASLIIPTVIASLERAEHLSLAMTSRGYNRE